MVFRLIVTGDTIESQVTGHRSLESIYKTCHEVTTGLLKISHMVTIVVLGVVHGIPSFSPILYPCAEAVIVVEYVVDQQLGFKLLRPFQLPGVGNLSVEQEIGVDSVAITAGVVSILLAHIFTY